VTDYTDGWLNYGVQQQYFSYTWRSVLLVEKTGVPGENHRPAASHGQTLSHNVVSSTPRHERGLNSQLYSGNRRWLRR